MNLFEIAEHFEKDRVATWKRQRIERGFSDYDAYDVDTFLIQLIPAMLRHLADHTHGHPIEYEHKEWQEWLRETAEYFERAHDISHNRINYCYTKEQREQLNNEYTKYLNEGFMRLAENFNHLWN